VAMTFKEFRTPVGTYDEVSTDAPASSESGPASSQSSYYTL